MMLGMLFGSFFILLALGVPIVFSMGISAGIYYVMSGYPLMQFVQKTIGGVDSFTLLAIPFFLLAGDIMGKGRYQPENASVCECVSRSADRRSGSHGSCI